MTMIGVAGLGRMGAAIAQRLIETGAGVVVWNRSAEKCEALRARGATVAPSPAALAAQCDVIITILTDAHAIEAVYRGPDGLLSAAVSTRLFIEMSTVRPQTEQALARDVAAAGAAFVECPVGGTVGPALKGQLLGFAGGEAAAVERARPVLEKLCRRFDHVGDVGAGSSFKLAINLPLAVYWQALGEAYALCEHLPIDRARMIEIFQETSGAPNVLKARGATVAEALGGKSLGPGLFDCDGMRKDLSTMIAEAGARGYQLPVAASALAVFDEASAAGWGARDCMEMPTYTVKRRS
ncbi:NAD(P)-dependent oxidoreductase [Phreatobacter sp.]|uniref:NAD(P)-dependent oxidoreductase n=1 Tax=Phreatobacter sp. TaxID=1966341 RepID=UPI0022C316E3|nr:NAD(P)-dependent oxidoreductase [Phreatobacter sp.]MCZ8315746.1 NAD(P)-dependent oxidoreductase [Phreatobacter sp.]